MLPFNPPALHERQIPNVLPLPTMLVQRLVMLASSAGLSVANVNGVSVVWKTAVAPACTVVPKAFSPGANGNAGPPARAALLVQFVPVKLALAAVFTSLTTIELGRTPVKVLLIRSWVTDKDCAQNGQDHNNDGFSLLVAVYCGEGAKRFR